MSDTKRSRVSLRISSRTAPRFKPAMPSTPLHSKQSTTSLAAEEGWVSDDVRDHFGSLKRVVANRRKSKAATVRDSMLGSLVQSMLTTEDEQGDSSKAPPEDSTGGIDIEQVDLEDILGPVVLEFEEGKATIPSDDELLVLTHAIRAVLTPFAQESRKLYAEDGSKSPLAPSHSKGIRNALRRQVHGKSRYVANLLHGTLAQLKGTYNASNYDGKHEQDYDASINVAAEPLAADNEENLSTSHLLHYLQRLYNVPTNFFRKLVSQELHWRDEYVAAELEHQLANLDQNIYYEKGQFASEADWEEWKLAARKNLSGLIRKVCDDQFEPKKPGFRGALHVQVIEANGLLGKDKSGKSDPYVKLKYSKQKYKTRVIDQNLNPVWNEHCSFEVYEPAGELKVQVWDKDAYGKDFLGQVILPLNHAEVLEPIDQHFTLDKRSKKSHVAGTLHLEVHFAPYLPPQKSSKPEPHHIHYRQLADKIHTFEQKRHQSFLSYSAKLILREYAAQRGLSDVFQLLTQLQVLVKHFHRDPVTLSEIHRTLTDLFNLTTDSDLVPKLMTREKEFFAQLILELDKLITNVLLNYKDSFPKNTPTGALSTAVLIYQTLAETSVFESAHDEEVSMESLFDNIIQSSISNSYENLAKSVRKQDNIAGYIRLADLILDEVQEDAMYFTKMAFPSEINVPVLSIKAYHSLYVLDLHNFLPSLRSKSKEVDPDIFALYFRLRDMDALFAEIIPGYHGLPIMELFHGFVQDWVTETADKLRGWTANALAADKWVPISEAKKHSSSVYDVFCCCFQYLDFFSTLEWPEADDHVKSNSTLAVLLAQSIKMVVVEYSMAIQQAFFAKLPKIKKIKRKMSENRGFFKRIFRRKTSHVLDMDNAYQLDISECVRLNDLFTADGQLEDFIQEMKRALSRSGNEATEEKVAMCVDSFKSSFHDLRQATQNMLQGLVDSITPAVFQATQDLIDAARENPADVPFGPFFHYLDAQLQIAADNMYYGLFRKLLRGSWNATCRHLIDIMVCQHKLTDTQLDVAVLCIMRMREFFHADGDGLMDTFLDINCEIAARTRELVNEPTEQLIALVAEYDAAEKKTAFSSAHVIHILAERSDKRAKLFCEEHSAAQHIQAAFRSRRTRRALATKKG